MQLFEQGADRVITWVNQQSSVGTGTTTVNMQNARHIVISNTHASNALFFTLDGSTPTSSNFHINAGQSLSMDGLPAIDTLKLVASGASTPVQILGW